MKKVTLKDIANEVGVTVGAVSHVLNGIDDISEETKERVLDAVDRLGYISNGSAVSLRSGKTNTIAIIIPDISNPHLAYQIKLIEDKMRRFNYSVIILNTNENEKTEHEAIVTACSKQVDGILLCPSQQSLKNIRFMNKLGIPYVLIGRYFADFDTDYVCADDVKGGYLAGEYLIKKGCKNPVYFGSYNYIEPSKNRFCGMCKAFSGNGIHIDESRVIDVSPDARDIDDAIEKLAEKSIVYDSIVAFSDLIGFKIISQIKKDVPIVCFDAINSHLYMPFYNISVGMVDNGWANKASSVLIDKINGKGKRCKEFIDVKLYEFNK